MHKRKILLCPLLHPRLHKSLDKSLYYHAPTQCNFRNLYLNLPSVTKVWTERMRSGLMLFGTMCIRVD